jgi:hypothetical protein
MKLPKEDRSAGSVRLGTPLTPGCHARAGRRPREPRPLKGDRVWFSEVSPRPHDTGLVTLVTQWQSEFELHARALLGLPVDAELRNAGASHVIYGGVDEEGIIFDGIDRRSPSKAANCACSASRSRSPGGAWSWLWPAATTSRRRGSGLRRPPLRSGRSGPAPDWHQAWLPIECAAKQPKACQRRPHVKLPESRSIDENSSD